MSTIQNFLARHERLIRLMFIFAAAAAMLLFAMVDPSLAASDVGNKVGAEIASWIGPTVLVVAAAALIPLFFTRRFGEMLGIGMVALVAGGFVFAPASMKSMISAVWTGLGFA